MHVDLVGLRDILAIQRMLDATLNQDGDRLVHLVAHHHAREGVAESLFNFFFGHYLATF